MLVVHVRVRMQGVKAAYAIRKGTRVGQRGDHGGAVVAAAGDVHCSTVLHHPTPSANTCTTPNKPKPRRNSPYLEVGAAHPSIHSNLPVHCGIVSAT